MKLFNEANLPARMQRLPRDKRGLPVPFIVARDVHGEPHFVINDHEKVAHVAKERRCAICGGKLGRYAWFVGGEQSAFHAHGGYNDPAGHKECLEFALKTCPFLALRKYSHRDDRLSTRVELANGATVLVDPTMIPGQPTLFVLAATQRYRVHERETGMLLFAPSRPWARVEYWREGARLDDAEGRRRVIEAHGEGSLEYLPEAGL